MSEEVAKAKFEDMKTASKVSYLYIIFNHWNKIDLTLGDEEPKVFQFLQSRLKLMLLRLEKALASCPQGKEEPSIAEKLLTNERDNFQAAVDYLIQLQSWTYNLKIWLRIYTKLQKNAKLTY